MCGLYAGVHRCPLVCACGRCGGLCWQVCRCSQVSTGVGGRLYSGVCIRVWVCGWLQVSQVSTDVCRRHVQVFVHAQVCAGPTGLCRWQVHSALSACVQGSRSCEMVGTQAKQAPWHVGWSQCPCPSGWTLPLQAGALVPGTSVCRGVARSRGSGRMTRKREQVP